MSRILLISLLLLSKGYAARDPFVAPNYVTCTNEVMIDEWQLIGLITNSHQQQALLKYQQQLYSLLVEEYLPQTEWQITSVNEHAITLQYRQEDRCQNRATTLELMR